MKRKRNMKTTVKKTVLPGWVDQGTAADRLGKKRPDLAAASQNPPAAYWVGQNLLRLRAKANLTQRELSEAAGVSFRGYQNIEECQPIANPTVKTLEALAAVLKVSVPELFKPHPHTYTVEA
jgi:DNA-binding XRE family transcriptional regulator